MPPPFRFPEIDISPNGFGGTFKEPLRLGSQVMESLRSPEVGKILETCEFVRGFSEGHYAASVGLVTRQYEQASMFLHACDPARLLSAPLEAEGRPYRTILVRRRSFPAAVLAGLERLRAEGFKKEVERALKDHKNFLEIGSSTAVSYQLAPLFERWELVAAYQKAVIETAGADVYFMDWSKEPENPCRKILIMGPFLPHMREVRDRASFEDASRLCANDLTLS